MGFFYVKIKGENIMFWYNKSIKDCITQLQTDEKTGLTSKRAKELLEKKRHKRTKTKKRKKQFFQNF